MSNRRQAKIDPTPYQDYLNRLAKEYGGEGYDLYEDAEDDLSKKSKGSNRLIRSLPDKAYPDYYEESYGKLTCSSVKGL